MYRCFFKRCIDIILSAFLMIILLPVYVILSILVRIKMGKPVLYSQERIGKNEKIFKLYKFRSMTNEKDENGKLLDETKRITNFGRVLRSTSLDELPELWSIFIGKMSFVGPRPLPTYYGPYFREAEKKRHEVRGGLIPPDGLSGVTTPEWETQFEYDIYYVSNVSLILDIKVIMATVKILCLRMKNDYGSERRLHLNEYRGQKEIKENNGKE